MDAQTYSDILELLHREVKPALGCTEPIAVALAVAKACSLFRPQQPSQVNVQVSANILKNAMGVGIPGTGMVGLNIAVALAMECGNPDYGLEVLKDLTPSDVERAKAYAAEGRVKISLAKTSKKLYIEAECLYGPVEVPEHRSRTVIQDDHDAVVFVSRDDEVLLDKMSAEDSTDAGAGQDTASHKTTLDYHLDMRKIFDFATKEARVEDISFMLDAARMNKALAEEGLAHPYGLQVGRTIQNCGIVWLSGGSFEQVCSAVKNMIGNITGMVCDGAKVGCALKVASGVSSAVQSAVLALDNHCVTGNDGIIEDDVEKEIHTQSRYHRIEGDAGY